MQKAMVVLALLASGVAHAEVRERLVVLIGVQLTSSQATDAHAKEADLAKKGIALFDDPSISDAAHAPLTIVTFAGSVVTDREIERGKPQSVKIPVPTPDDVKAAKSLLARNELPDDVAVVALVAFSGGK